MYRLFSLVAALLPLASAAFAQTSDRLIGITRNFANLRQFDHQNCQGLGQCGPSNFPNALALPPGAGGTAWDPRTSGAWITNGSVLAKVADDCTYQCAPQPIVVPSNTVATGLTMIESQGKLLMIDSSGTLHTFTASCPPVLQGTCQTGLTSTGLSETTTGLAADEGLGLLFYGVTNFQTGDSAIAVALLSDPCTILNRVTLGPCATPIGNMSFGSITGVAADWCHRFLYVTDGRNTRRLRYVPLAVTIGIVGSTCCQPPVINIDPMIGLAVRSGGATSMGAACANGACPSCPMAHDIANDPNVGNLDFRLSLDGAPVASLAWAVIGGGPCAPTGLIVPGLCGPVWLQNVLGTLGPEPTGGVSGTGPCAGSGSLQLPIPLIPSLCGSVISSQSIALCSNIAGQLGTAMSNCISFELQGN